MYNFYYEGKRFKNGNLNIRFSPDEIKEAKTYGQRKTYDHKSDFDILNEKLFAMDTVFTNEENYYYNDQSWILYNYHDNKEYELYSSDFKKLLAGKTLKLKARKPSQETIARLNLED